ncbi:MAG: A/G-specific adenine glycosylase [Clostridia bacterium]|nr:A/G-specific adenine glycosylase [Clostridia bacterium]
MESFARRIIDWYDRGHRDFPWRNTKDPYHIWVSEIMLQQTRAETVISYYNRFMARFPTLEALANAKETELLKAWEGLGYYSRARNLQKCAVQVLTEYGGHFPETPEELMRLPGIGPYTAGAVASIAFGCRCSAVDGNVLRVMARVEGIEDDIRRPETVRLIRERTDARLPDRDCDRFSNAMMELGACICVPRHPQCEECPVAELCQARKTGRQEQLPVRSKAKPQRVENRDILLLYFNDRVLVERQGEGLLEGLYFFPSLTDWHSEEERLAWLSGQGMTCQLLCEQKPARHVFSHVIWEMRIYEYRVTTLRRDKRTWVTAKQLVELPMATAIKKARQYCLARLNENASVIYNLPLHR